MRTYVLRTLAQFVDPARDDDSDGQEFAEAEDVLDGRGQLHAQAVDQGHHGYKGIEQERYPELIYSTRSFKVKLDIASVL